MAKLIRVIVSKPTLGQHAAEPVSTDEVFVSLGYKVLRPITRSSSSMMTHYRHSGGKRGGYCPLKS